MLEIKTELNPSRPAIPAQPGGVKRWTATVDGYEVTWQPDSAAVHLYPPGWWGRKNQPPAAEFRKWAAVLAEVAATMEAQKDNEKTDEGGHRQGQGNG